MLVLEIELLTGRYVAKEYDDHASAEWPPHPARVFSALAAAHFEDPVEGDSARDEREALDWLAEQPAPSIYSSDAARRTVLDVFVPANDKSIDPSVSEVVREAMLATDERGRGRAWSRFEKINKSADEFVALTRAQGEQLRLSIDAIARLVVADDDSSRIQAAIEDLSASSRKMLEDRPSRLLKRAISGIARLRCGDKSKLLKQLLALKQGLDGQELVKRAASVLPAAAERKQARTFPSVYALDSIVHFHWSDEPEERLRKALEELAARVTRLGHSSSLVRLAWTSVGRKPTWIPDPDGAYTLRWVSPRQIEELMSAHEVHGGTANRILPFVPANYRRSTDPDGPATESPPGIFGRDWVVFELLGKTRLPIVRTVDVAVALRGAALANAGPPSAEILSGHGPSGGATDRPHVAYVALPFVSFPYADGSILGVAAVLPSGLVGAERRAVLRALGGIQRLTLSSDVAFDVRRVTEPHPHLRTLDPLLWCSEATVWGTVTPILLDRFPGRLGSRNIAAADRAEREAQDAIFTACERTGLPRPCRVSISAPCFRGSVAANQFRRRDHRGLPPRVRVHALIDFGQRIRGPVLLGAGRYVGLGLCRPLVEPERS
jgi:CRISPR-associated protein Csb2